MPKSVQATVRCSIFIIYISFIVACLSDDNKMVFFKLSGIYAFFFFFVFIFVLNHDSVESSQSRAVRSSLRNSTTQQKEG